MVVTRVRVRADVLQDVIDSLLAIAYDRIEGTLDSQRVTGDGERRSLHGTPGQVGFPGFRFALSEKSG
jgi:hypothetical protein